MSDNFTVDGEWSPYLCQVLVKFTAHQKETAVNDFIASTKEDM